MSLALIQLPPSQVAVVSGGEDELTNLKVRVRSENLQRPKNSSRQTQTKILQHSAGFTAVDKEVETTHITHTSYYLIFITYRDTILLIC